MQGDREYRIRNRQQAKRQNKRAASQQEADELAVFYLTALQDTP